MYLTACRLPSGLWNVPYISACYLIKRSVVDDKRTRPSFISGLLDADMAFCENMRAAVHQHLGRSGAGLGRCWTDQERFGTDLGCLGQTWGGVDRPREV